MNRAARNPLFTLALALVGHSALAADVAPLDVFWIGAGVYESRNDLDIRLDGRDLAAGTNVNLQRDFGFDNRENAASFEAGFTVANRHQIAASMHRYDSSSTRTLTNTFDIDDQQFAVDAAFAGTLDVRTTTVGYTYFFHSTESSAFGVGIGGVRYGVEAQLSAIGQLDDGSGQPELISANVRKSEDVWAPLLRAQYSRMLGERWRLGLELAGVKKSGGSVQGDALDAIAGVDYFPWQNVGLSLRYNYNNVSLEYDKVSYLGTLDLKNRGPSINALIRF